MISTSARPDFRDWLSPMLVKELRQGMRSRIFVAAFYLTQLLMILTAIFNVTALNAESPREMSFFFHGLFWFMIALPLLVLMPARGFGALHSEIKSGTLELVFLTRLSAWRIAAGKWMALMVQTLLLVCAILPYVLLRYFLGGINVIEDVQTLFLLVVASAAFTATTLAISPYESKLLRMLLVSGLAVCLPFLFSLFFGFVAFRAFAGGPASSILPWQVYVGIALFVPAFVALGIEMAASRIAPSAENHAVRKRLLGVSFLVAACVMHQIGGDGIIFFNLAAVFVAIVAIDALAEPHSHVPMISRKFLRRGPAGRLVGLLLTPGWVSAAWFVLALFAITALAAWFLGVLGDARGVLHVIAFFGWIVFPAAVLRLVAPRTPNFLGLYIALQFLLTAITVLSSMAAGIVGGKDSLVWLGLIPNCTFLFHSARAIDDTEILAFLAPTTMVTAASLALLLARTITPLHAMRQNLQKGSAEHA